MDELFCLRLGSNHLSAIDFADGHVVQVLQPAISSLCQLDIEHASVDDLSHRGLAIIALDHLGAVIELLDEISDRLPAARIYSVHLIQHDDICKLNLVNHQIRDGALIFGRDVVSAG